MTTKLPPSAIEALYGMIDTYGYDQVMLAGRDHMMRSGKKLPHSITSQGGIKVQRLIRFLETAHPDARVFFKRGYNRIIRAALDVTPIGLGSEPIVMLYDKESIYNVGG